MAHNTHAHSAEAEAAEVSRWNARSRSETVRMCRIIGCPPAALLERAGLGSKQPVDSGHNWFQKIELLKYAEGRADCRDGLNYGLRSPSPERVLYFCHVESCRCQQ